MENTKARSNIYALLSRVLLQELDDKMLNTIKNDETILDFSQLLKSGSHLKQRIIKNF